MPKGDAVAELAQKLLHALEQQRQSGRDYPLTVARLAALVDPQATPEQVRKALGKQPYAARWVVARKKDANSPIALTEDSERLAASSLLVEFALGLVCSADKPVHTPIKAVNKVDKTLRPAFKAALERQIAANALPPTVGVTTVRGKPHLYLRRFPPPKNPAEELSEKLVQVLIDQRERGPDAYPATLDRLIEQTGLSPKPAVLKQALSREPFRSQAVRAMPRQPDSLVALAADTERLISSAALLHRVLAAARTADNQAVTVAELKKKVSVSWQGPFAESVTGRLTAGALPDGIGVLRIKKKPLLFLLADLNSAIGHRLSAIGPRPAADSRRPMAEVPAPAVDFARLFDEAFARLDRDHGSHNHVSLLALRRAVPVDRAAFDVGLQQLRRAGRYSLSAAEGRHGLRADEQNAAIHEDGSVLLFVSRREV